MEAQEGLNRELRLLVEKYSEVAQEVLRERLVSLVLYGSLARGQAGPGSDIDLFVVLDAAPKGMFLRREILKPLRERLSPDLERLWQRGLLTDFVEVIRSREEASRFHPLYLDMTEEAEVLYDRDGFFTGVLQGVRRRMRELGAQRKILGRLSYWHLKPDLKPGEALEL